MIVVAGLNAKKVWVFSVVEETVNSHGVVLELLTRITRLTARNITIRHRTRIKTEEKAKCATSFWGEEFIQFLAARAVLLRMVLNNSIIG